MTILTIYVIAVVFFCMSFYFTRVVDTCRQVLDIIHESTGVLSDSNLDDLTKEKAIKKAALNMVEQCFVLFIKLLIILAFTVLPMWLGDIMKLAMLSETSQFAMRWDVLVTTTIVVLVPVMILRKKR